MASEYTYINQGKTEVKNMYVNQGKDLVKIVRVNNGKQVVHRASYEVTRNSPTGVVVSEPVTRIGKHGLKLTYNIAADAEDRVDTVTSTWGPGILTKTLNAAEWTYVTPTITSDGSVTINAVSAYVSVPSVTSDPPNFTTPSGNSITLTGQAYANLDSSVAYQWYADDPDVSFTLISSSQSVVINNAPSYMLYVCRAQHVDSGIWSGYSDGVSITYSAAQQPSASFTTQRLSYNEGQSQIWYFTKSNITTVWWRIIGYGTNPASGSDFSVSTGSTSGTSITIETVNDLSTEGVEKFQVQIADSNTFSNILATSSVASIADTSKTPENMTVVTSPTNSMWNEGNLNASYTHNFSSTVYDAPGTVTYSWVLSNESHPSAISVIGGSTGSSFSVQTTGSGGSVTMSFTVTLTVTSNGETAQDSSTGSTIYGIVQ